MSDVSFPRLHARTRSFRLGAPRSFSVSADGSRVVFLRSAAGDDPVNSLWILDTGTGEERCVVDARSLGVDESDLPAEERARRERSREVAGGITGYSLDAAAQRAAFTLAGSLYVAELDDSGVVVHLPAHPGVFDPRISPTGTHVAYVSGGTLYIDLVENGETVITVAPAIGETEVSWGVADFAAAEEMGRNRGFWWSPDGLALLVARVDNTPVAIRWISDPAHPEAAPVAHRYPAAGTANADVTLWRIGLDGARAEIAWDHGAHPYLATVDWSTDPVFSVQNRAQTEVITYRVDNGEPMEIARQSDPS